MRYRIECFDETSRRRKVVTCDEQKARAFIESQGYVLDAGVDLVGDWDSSMTFGFNLVVTHASLRNK